MRARLVVLVSGGGTNLQALIDARQEAYEIVGVVSETEVPAVIAMAGAVWSRMTVAVSVAVTPDSVTWLPRLA